MRRGTVRAGGAVLLLILFLAGGSHLPRALAHPFDGDGPGEAKDGRNAQVYLYLEPEGARLECLLWLPAALSRLGLPGGGDLLLPPAQRQELEQRARQSGAAWPGLRADGVTLAGSLEGVSVLKGMPGRSETVPSGDALPVMEGMLGLVWHFDIPKDAKALELSWNGFDDSVAQVPATIFYGPMAESGLEMTAESPVVSWETQGRIPGRTQAQRVPPVPPRPTVGIPAASLLWGLLSGGLVILAFHRSPGMTRPRRALSLAAIVIGTVLLWPVGRYPFVLPGTPAPQVTPQEATGILDSLVRNIYQAFEAREESAIYDVLADSVEGPLLQTLYLQTVQALTLEGRDGTRVQVKELYVHVDKTVPLPEGEGFLADCQWTALGTVGHWGHLHQRINRYTARVTITPVQGIWKMTGLEVIEERRM
jgi:hypothetical protein